ncbi:type IV pilin-like G/H family protein [Planktothrix serta]|uniref:type IV pilin-like G/H family protein n=1 Tax=Planktothrix serta TaxID=1678310 RepID=UPI0018CC13FC|nr:type IV pilin-like G/H family protein [Planktothrix serta]
MPILICFVLFALITFPSFDARVRNIKQLEAKEILLALIKNQNYQLKHYNKFTPKLDNLYRGIAQGTRNYQYKMNVRSEQVLFEVSANLPRIKSYSGALFIVKIQGSMVRVGGICQSNDLTSIPPTPILPPSPGSKEIRCPAGSQLIEAMQFID